MDNEIKTWLYDILQSINEIDGYFEDKHANLKNIVKTPKQNVPSNEILRLLERL